MEAPEAVSNVGSAAETSSQASTSESAVVFDGKAMAHSGSNDPVIGNQPGTQDTSTIFISKGNYLLCL